MLLHFSNTTLFKLKKIELTEKAEHTLIREIMLHLSSLTK
jgi:hypothetical protein